MGPEEPRVRILLADDQALFREAVRVVLANEDDFEVVGEARDGYEAVAEAERSRPDVILMYADLPLLDGIQATSLIRERFPEIRVLLLNEHHDERTLVEAVEAGATGFLTKTASMAELIAAARALRRGEAVILPTMLENLLTHLVLKRKDQDEAYRRMSRLTQREKEVLALLAEGADNEAIAAALVISPQTARTHIQNILAKLQVHSRLEAAAFAAKNGIIRTLPRESV